MSRSATDPPNRAIRVALIGAGQMASEHAKALADILCVEIVGVCTRTIEKGRQFAAARGISTVASSVAELHAATGADLAIVAVPELAIAAVMREVLALPWTVMMEKPVGLDLASAEATANLARKAGRTVFVGLNRRLLSSTQAALDDLAGSPQRFIHVQDQQSLEVARSIGQPPEVVLNWMYANSIHLVDYLLAFGRGVVKSVELVRRWNPTQPGTVLAHVTFDSGDHGLYEAIWNGPGPWACTVTTAAKRWELRPLEQARFQRVGERALHTVDTSAWDKDFKPGFRLQAERLIGHVRGTAGGLPRIEDGVRTMRLVRDIYQ